MSTTIGGRWEAFFTVPSSVAISVTTNAGGPTTVNITAGTYTARSLCAHLQAVLIAQRPVTAGTWTVTLSTGRGGTGRVTIAVTNGTYSISWTSTLLRDLLGFASNITTQTTATGTIVHAGVWMPSCPLVTDLHPTSAPKRTDNRSTKGPQGEVVTLGGLKEYVHKGIRYSHVDVGRIREVDASTPGNSLEAWLDDTQFGDSHTWFSRGSAFQIYWDNGGEETLVGKDLNSNTGPANGWRFSPAIESMEAHVRRVGDWLGMWSVSMPDIFSSG